MPFTSPSDLSKAPFLNVHHLIEPELPLIQQVQDIAISLVTALGERKEKGVWGKNVWSLGQQLLSQPSEAARAKEIGGHHQLPLKKRSGSSPHADLRHGSALLYLLPARDQGRQGFRRPHLAWLHSCPRRPAANTGWKQGQGEHSFVRAPK